MFTPYRVALAPAWKPYRILLLFTHTNGLESVAPCKEIQIPESYKSLLEESGIWETFSWGSEIWGFGIWNTARGIPNPINDWNLESKFHRQRPESSTWNPESTAWNPESNTVLDFLTWGEKWSVIYRIGSVKCDPPRRVTLLAKPTFYRFFVCLFFIFLM